MRTVLRKVISALVLATLVTLTVIGTCNPKTQTTVFAEVAEGDEIPIDWGGGTT